MKRSVWIGIIVGIIIVCVIGYLIFFTNNKSSDEPLILKGTITSTESEKVPGEITAFEFKSEDGEELLLNIEKADFVDKDGNEITFDKIKIGDVVQVTTEKDGIFLASNFLKPSEIRVVETYNELDEVLRNSISNCIENGGSVCMPWDPSGKCFHYNTGAKSCNVVVNLIKEGNFTTELCYELDKELLIAYCLSQTNLNECFEYASGNPSAEKVCKTIDCQINGREAYPSELNLSDALESLEYENCVDVWESYEK